MKISKQSRLIHHRLQVHLRDDRIGFEVLLPCDAIIVTGLSVSAKPGGVNLASVGNRSDKAGNLTLRWNYPGDIFYQGPVFTAHRSEDNYQMLGLVPPDRFFTGWGGFAIESTAIEPVEVAVPGRLRLVKGYYQDVINRLGGQDENYTVDLFFHYQSAQR